MKILQITDLHFGSHNAELALTLKSRVAEIAPDVIVATGDLVNTPKGGLFQQAHKYLIELKPLCTPSNDPNRPALIVVPGNHDFLYTGIVRSPFGPRYSKFFGGMTTEFYFKPEKVWIFGFDSASSRQFATGEVLRNELVRFHNHFDSLRRADPTFEEEAFKIVLIHHHPLPVNWQTDWQQRWLTMINSGTFLGAMMDRKINLILHGHEHLQGRARLESSLGGGGKAEVVVISLGATLKQVNNPAQNWFNLISIEPPGKPTGRTVTVSSFPANQVRFEDDAEVYVVQSAEAGVLQDFERRKKQNGFYYHQVASITDLNIDGDCQRFVECENLEILDLRSKRSLTHELDLPHSSGDFDLLEVETDPDSRFQGIHIDVRSSQTNPQTLAATIEYGKRVVRGDTISYRYKWWALNAFAMDGRQFRYKYGDPSSLEFTHFPVTDPIKELTVVVQFPRGFSPASKPQVRVTRPDASVSDNRCWEHATDLEEQLVESEALRYIESLRVAALRVSFPQSGYCYGIEWKVPEGRVDEIDPVVQQLHERLLISCRNSPAGPHLLKILAEIGFIAVQVLIPGWTEPLGINLMIFDENARKLVVAGAATLASPPIAADESDVTFGYGSGIAGRVFKSNEPRLFVYVKRQKQKDPNYYRFLPNRVPNHVLLAVPIRSPDKRQHVYGVLNLTSSNPACPLAHVLEPGSPVSDKILGTFQSALNECILSSLRALSSQGLI